MVGAGVLTTLAVIILPMLLDGTSEDRARVMATIPEPPLIELKKLTMDDALRKMREMEQNSAAQLPQFEPDTRSYSEPSVSTKSAASSASAKQDRRTPELALDKNLLPVSWSLQLGSFQDPSNAQRLKQQLREDGYRTYIVRAKTDDDKGETFRVYIGPMLKRNELEVIAEAVRKKLNIEGQIVRYRLEDDAGQLGG